jgi:prepilin-type N-terminal cleavage/methylation domain-containing protein
MPTSPRQRGLTLLELLLVLALIVIVFALAIPSLTSALGSQRLKKAADLVRSSLSRARVEAMRSGQIQAFRFQVGGNRYATVTWHAEGYVTTDEDAEFAEGPTAPSGLAFDRQNTDELPEGVTFLVEAQVIDARAVAFAEEDSATAGLTGDLDTTWSTPILFYPDGTASDARVFLASDRGWAVPIDLRGLTGIARVGEMEKIELAGLDAAIGTQEP